MPEIIHEEDCREVEQMEDTCPVLEAGFRMPGATVSQALDRVLGDKPGRRSITVDHRTEF